MSDSDIFEKVTRGRMTAAEGAHVMAERRQRRAKSSSAPVAIVVIGMVIVAACAVAKVASFAIHRGAESVDSVKP